MLATVISSDRAKATTTMMMTMMTMTTQGMTTTTMTTQGMMTTTMTIQGTMMTNNQLRHDAASSEWQSADSIRAMADYLARSVSDAGAFAYKVSAKTGKSLSG